MGTYSISSNSSRKRLYIRGSARSEEKNSYIYNTRTTIISEQQSGAVSDEWSCDDLDPLHPSSSDSDHNETETFGEVTIGLNGVEQGLNNNDEGVGKSTKFYIISDFLNIGLYGASTPTDGSNEFIYATAHERDGETEFNVTKFDKNNNRKHSIPDVTANGEAVYGDGTYILVKQYAKQTTKTLRTTTKENGIIVSITDRRI